MNRTPKCLGILRVFILVKTYSDIWDNMGGGTVLSLTRFRCEDFYWWLLISLRNAKNSICHIINMPELQGTFHTFLTITKPEACSLWNVRESAVLYWHTRDSLQNSFECSLLEHLFLCREEKKTSERDCSEFFVLRLLI